MLKENEPIQCDILLLATGCNGICFVETVGLDGELNLKIK